MVGRLDCRHIYIFLIESYVRSVTIDCRIWFEWQPKLTRIDVDLNICNIMSNDTIHIFIGNIDLNNSISLSLSFKG